MLRNEPLNIGKFLVIFDIYMPLLELPDRKILL
jgi:hypothetical protein